MTGSMSAIQIWCPFESEITHVNMLPFFLTRGHLIFNEQKYKKIWKKYKDLTKTGLPYL